MALPKKIIDLINLQIRLEHTNSLVYLAMSIWLNKNGWFGASELFKSYSDDEIIHRDKFINYLLDLNELPIAPSDIEGDIIKSFKGIEEIINAAYKREQDTTNNIIIIKEAAFASKDFVTITFLDWFINEQIEELAKTLYWVDRIAMMKSVNVSLFFLDEEMKNSIKK